MKFWKIASPHNVITEDLILRSVDHCPLKSKWEGRRLKRDLAKGDTDVVRGRIDRLWPYTAISATVSVLNSARQGPPSAAVYFHTKESGMLLGLLQFRVEASISVC